MPLKATVQKAKFDKENCRRLQLKLNIRTDADILAQLEKQPSMQGYIRSLIRADIATQAEKEADKS